eukprot:g2675.t1
MQTEMRIGSVLRWSAGSKNLVYRFFVQWIFWSACDPAHPCFTVTVRVNDNRSVSGKNLRISLLMTACLPIALCVLWLECLFALPFIGTQQILQPFAKEPRVPKLRDQFQEQIAPDLQSRANDVDSEQAGAATATSARKVGQEQAGAVAANAAGKNRPGQATSEATAARNDRPEEATSATTTGVGPEQAGGAAATAARTTEQMLKLEPDELALFEMSHEELREYYRRGVEVASPEDIYVQLGQFAKSIKYPAELLRSQSQRKKTNSPAGPAPQAGEQAGQSSSQSVDEGGVAVGLLEEDEQVKPEEKGEKSVVNTMADSVPVDQVAEGLNTNFLQEGQQFRISATTTTPPDEIGGFSQVEEEFAKLPFPDQLYYKLNNLFGNDDTLLTMEWPGRVLDMKSFQYNITDAYSGYLKPVAVRDAEFSLCDELFPAAQITGGPLGSGLAMMYSLVLGELTERIDYPSGAYKARRLQVIQKLQELHKGPDGNLQTLRAIHEYWLNRYVQVKGTLQAELNDRKQLGREMEYEDDKHELFDSIPILNDKVQAQLNAAWKDLIIQGRHHEVMSLLSILDAASPGQLLQETKDRMRNTGQSSLDGTETTYPVWMQPRDWHMSLTSNFRPRDLLMEPDALIMDMELDALIMDVMEPDALIMDVAMLEGQRSSALKELSSLQAIYQGDPDVLRDQVDRMKEELNKARIKMSTHISESLGNLVSMVCPQARQCLAMALGVAHAMHGDPSAILSLASVGAAYNDKKEAEKADQERLAQLDEMAKNINKTNPFTPEFMKKLENSDLNADQKQQWIQTAQKMAKGEYVTPEEKTDVDQIADAIFGFAAKHELYMKMSGKLNDMMQQLSLAEVSEWKERKETLQRKIGSMDVAIQQKMPRDLKRL